MTEKEKTKLYEDYHLKVRNFILSKVNNFPLAEDLTSEVFVKVYSNIEKFDSTKSSLSTWIFTITRRHLIDYYRTRKVNVELNENIAIEIDESICTEDNLDCLKNGLKNLDQRLKDIIVLHYFKKMTLKDVAIKMGISYAYVKILHAKALISLRKYFN